jgi:glycosyltransferase involved in cell wall biosynthesis
MAEKLTVIIPCRNERKNIRLCVESVREVADEIIVADSLSTDDTVEIVKSLGGCRIVQREFVGYVDFKNWAIPQARHNWVLIVDADERVTPELAREIRQVLQSPPESIDAYWIYRRNFFMGHEIRHCGWNTDDVCRLIRRDRCRYGAKRVHEEIEVERHRTAWLKNRLVHHSIWSYDDYFRKRIQYTQLSAQDAWQDHKRTSSFDLLVRPMLRFLQLYILRLGFLDGMPGIQVCMLTAYFNTFVRQARLWEMQYALPQPDPEQERADARASTNDSMAA